MASIQRIKSPLTGEISYRVQVRVKGRPTESKTFSNQQRAKAWAKTVEGAIEEGRDLPHRRAARTPFDGLVARYRDSFLKDSLVANKEAREQHLAWFAKRFVGLTLAEITADRVAEARDALAAESFTRAKKRDDEHGNLIAPKEYKRSGSTVNRYLATLSHMYTLAVREWRLLDRNPVREITKRKESRGRVRFLSDEERHALLNACTQSKWKPLYALVLLAISTGARRSELIHLKWCDVSLESKKAQAIVHETKNGDPRVLPLVGRTLEALRELKLQGSARSEYVFPQPSGFPGPFEHFDSHWYEAVGQAGIMNVRFHDLRHTCASYLASQGASLLEIADTLGHRTMQMVKRYSHLAQSHKVNVIEEMAEAKGL